jgi:hypothetical protein
MRQLLGFAGLLLAASASAAGHRIWEIRVQMIAPASMRMAPGRSARCRANSTKVQSRRLAAEAPKCRLKEALTESGSFPHGFSALRGRTLEPGLAEPLLASRLGCLQSSLPTLLPAFFVGHLLPPNRATVATMAGVHRQAACEAP